MPKKGIKPQLYRRIGIMCAYVFGLVLGDEMSGLAEQGKGPITFLMDNSSKLSSVIGPNGAWLFGETLSATKGSVLNGD